MIKQVIAISTLMIAGVFHVPIISTLASFCPSTEINRSGIVKGEACQLAGQDRRSDRYSERLPGSKRLPNIPEYVDGQPVKYQMPPLPKQSEKAEAKVKYPPNCLLIWTAEWCSKCSRMKAIGDKLKQEGFDVFYIDFDKNKEEARESKIDGVPMAIIYTDSKEVRRIVGINQKTEKKVEVQIREVLKKNGEKEKPDNYDVY